MAEEQKAARVGRRREGAWSAVVLPRAHERELRAALASGPGELAVAEGYSTTLRVWNRQGRLLRAVALPAPPTGLARVGERVVAVCHRQLALVDGGDVVATTPCDEATSVAASPDGRTVAAFSRKKLGLFDPRDLRLRRELTVRPGALAWCRRGKAIACLRFGARKLVVTPVTGRGAPVELALPEKAWVLAADRAGRVLAAAGGSRIWLWDEALEAPRTLDLGGGWVQFLAISPDGARLATSASGDVRVFRVRDGAELGRLTGSSRNAAISFDGDALLEAGDELRVWTSKA